MVRRHPGRKDTLLALCRTSGSGLITGEFATSINVGSTPDRVFGPSCGFQDGQGGHGAAEEL
jgi:hypothetical protein